MKSNLEKLKDYFAEKYNLKTEEEKLQYIADEIGVDFDRLVFMDAETETMLTDVIDVLGV